MWNTGQLPQALVISDIPASESFPQGGNLVDVLVPDPGAEAERERHDEVVLELRVDRRERPALLLARLRRLPPRAWGGEVTRSCTSADGTRLRMDELELMRPTSLRRAPW